MTILRLNGSTSGYTELSAPAAAGSNRLTLPTGNGTSGQVLTTDGSGTLSFQWNAGALFYRLNSDLAGANSSAAQSLFGVGVTVASSTVYSLEAAFVLNKTAGISSHTIGLGFGGTATLNNILYQVTGLGTTTAYPSVTAPAVANAVTAATNNTMTAAIANAASNFRAIMQGTVSINAGGTFIPQYTLSAAPGGAYSTIAGSYIKLTPLGAAGGNNSQGTWA